MIDNDWTRLKEGAYLSPDKKALVLKVHDPSRLQNCFPSTHCRVVPFQGMQLVAVPYATETLRLLRNLGYGTRGLEMLRHTYQLPLVEGKSPLMPHQVVTAAFLSENKHGYCTSTMRTGKTASAIVAARFLQERRVATACLCIATKTNMRGVWEKEILGMYPDAKVVVVHNKDPEKRRQQLDRDADFYIINYDGIKIVKDQLISHIQAGRISVAIVDELTHYANTRSQLWDIADQVLNGTRWKTIPGKVTVNCEGQAIKTRDGRRRLPKGRGVEYLWGLTGTPGGPEMIYGQVRLITPENMDMAFTTWRDHTMVKVGYKWVPRDGYKEAIQQRMQPCIRFDKKDIMKLPPVTFCGADAEMSEEQKKYYKKVRKDMAALIESGGEILAVNKAALSSKLLQITQGAVILEDGEIHRLDVKPRIDRLVELIETASRKVVIFCAFSAVIDVVEYNLLERGYTVGVVSGRVTTGRDAVFRAFQEDKDPHIIICHPKTTAFGVELAAADTMIFYGPPMSGEFVYQQATERMSSLKQTADSIQIIHQAACTEERRLFKSIKDGVSINEAINDMFTISPDDM